MSAVPQAALDGRRLDRIRTLHRRRPRSAFLRYSVAVAALLVLASWCRSALWPEAFLSPRRLANLRRFLGELVPYPLQGEAFDWGVALSWATSLWQSKGWQAAGTTLALSVAAIVLAAAAAVIGSWTAARTLATAEPYLPSLRPVPLRRRLIWHGVVFVSRGLLMFSRALPEYIWAFLLLAILGPSPWPIVLALALHNFGILGKLGAEVIEDLDPKPLQALRGLGAGRRQIVFAGLLPLTLGRGLLYFFYRWETCVREATVLGMLGIVSLGYWIVDARARTHHDEMFFFVLIGAALVLLGDGVSILVRGFIRRAA